MKLQHVVVVVVFFIGACRSISDDDVTTVSVSIDQSAMHVGENVTLNCRVSSSKVDLSTTRFQWRKSTTSDDDNEEVIADGEDLSSLYRQFGEGRYEVVMVPLSDDVTFYILHIHLVQHEDSGRIRCALPSASYSRDQDIVNLQVYKRPSPDGVYFADYPEGAELTVEEDIPTSITCIVRGVLPQPHVSIHVHNRSLGGHLPINSTVNVHCPVAVGQLSRSSAPPKTCPVHYDLDLAVTATHLLATHRDDEQRVTCTAGLSHANWTPVTATLYLNVRYKPRFNCSRSLSVELGSRNVAVRCQLRYNPRPLLLLVRWRHHGDSDDTTLDVGSAIDDRYSLHETVIDAKSWKHTEMVFVINKVHHKDYAVYHFEATNDVGTSNHAVHLLQHHPSRTSDSVLTKPPTSTWTHSTRPPSASPRLEPDVSSSCATPLIVSELLSTLTVTFGMTRLWLIICSHR